MRLTTNGATPSATDPIVVSGSTMSVGNFTLKVRAFKANALDSAVAEATYTLSGPLTAGTLSAGVNHSLAATSDGRVYAWGTNGSNQLGDGTTTQRNSPTLVPVVSGITMVAAGSAHSLAATHDGRLYAWGSNGSGRLGDGTTTTRTTPVLITGAPANVTAIAAGERSVWRCPAARSMRGGWAPAGSSASARRRPSRRRRSCPACRTSLRSRRAARTASP